MQRDLDVVVFGATGDTGTMACACLYFQGKKLGLKSWAPAVRNLGKLKKDLLDRLQGVSPGADGLQPAEPIEADGNDLESLKRMCARTKCVIACAGPYAEYGEGVVRACAEVGTNYVDVTGETPWVEKMVGRYGAQAQSKGVSLVSCAGYDSIPPDITAYLAAKAFEKEGERLSRFEAFCGGAGGAMPTGTLNTLLGGIAAGKRAALRVFTFGILGKEPLKPKRSEAPVPSTGETFVPGAELSNMSSNTRWSMIPGYSSLAGQFCLPHFMAPINTFTVHHTAAKEGYSGLAYRERMAMGAVGPASLYGLLPVVIGVGTGVVLGFMATMPGFCALALKLQNTFMPPLTQKTKESALAGYQSTGSTVVIGYGISDKGRKVDVNLQCNYDPGLGFTMLACCVTAAQIVKSSGTASPAKAGYNSAVVAVGGQNLADALRAAGMTLEVKLQSKL